MEYEEKMDELETEDLEPSERIEIGPVVPDDDPPQEEDRLSRLEGLIRRIGDTVDDLVRNLPRPRFSLIERGVGDKRFAVIENTESGSIELASFSNVVDAEHFTDLLRRGLWGKKPDDAGTEEVD